MTVPQTKTAKPEISETQSSQHLQKLLDDIWQYELSISPGMAKSRGQSPKRALRDISLPALNNQAAQFQKFLAALDKVDSNNLSDS